MEYSIVLRDCKILNVGIRIEGSILGNDVEIVRGPNQTARPPVYDRRPKQD